MRRRPSHIATARPVRQALGRLFLAAGLTVLVMMLIGAISLYVRHCQRTLGVGAVEGPVLNATTAWGDDLARTGRFTANIAFTDFAVPGDGETEIALTWDDNWFFDESTAYNPELACAGSVIASLAYAESGYYQADSDCLPYMELGLSALGMTNISTDSYRYRSEVVDEVLGLVTQEADGAAFGIAEKRIVSDTGEERQLIVASIRGSYGSEWLSNLSVMGGEDHPGYTGAADEVARALAPRIERAREAGLAVELLLVGHSRGGAIANLVAARADDGTFGDGVNVCAYTYASPATTLAEDAGSARYANIFNIANPADIMTHLPLEGWGYARYGVDVALPGVTDADFAARYEKMQVTFEQVMGAASPYNPDDELLIESLTSDIAGQVKTVEELYTPAGVASVVSTVALRVSPWELLYAHYPSVYIAWLASFVGTPQS